MGDLININLEVIRHNPWLAVGGAFHLWMLIDALRREEWGWAVFIFFCPGFGDGWYFFQVFRGSPSATQGFELPGAGQRQRIKQLQAQIHHLDKAHHHLALGDIYFQKGKLEKAEASYRASLERDPADIDTRAHLGQCLLRQKKPEAARALLQQVCTENIKHDYGYSLMAYAETLMAMNDIPNAIATWKIVLENHSYARARVQLAELYLKTDQKPQALGELRATLNDDLHAPPFQRKRERVWIRKAKSLLRQNK